MYQPRSLYEYNYEEFLQPYKLMENTLTVPHFKTGVFNVNRNYYRH